MTLHAPVFPAGTRVVVRHGRLPLNPALLGRAGTVVSTDPYSPGRYDVLLDGDRDPVNLAQDELSAEPSKA